MHTGHSTCGVFVLKKMSRRQGESTPTHPFLKMEASTSLQIPGPEWGVTRDLDPQPLAVTEKKSRSRRRLAC
jgi:hypothetical protein